MARARQRKREPGLRTALVTGASAGIGEAFAWLLAKEGANLVLTARRAERLDALKQDLEARYGITVLALPADLGRADAVMSLLDRVEAEGLTLDCAIANAGYAVPGRFVDSDWATQAAQIQVMLTGLAELNHRLIPGMVARGYGRIVNVASVAGFAPGSPGGALYTPIKSFVIKLSEALALEHEGDNVHVCALCPGLTRTEFHDAPGTRMDIGSMPDALWMGADEVAREGLDAVIAGRPVHVTGLANKGFTAMARLTPDGVARAAMRRSRLFRRRDEDDG